MFRSAVSWMASPLMLTALGETVTRRGNTHQYFAPVSVYPTRDGHVYLAVGNDRQWEALTQLPGFVSLARPVYQRNAGRIAAASELNWQMADCTRGWKSAELMAALNRIGVPVARVNSLPQVLAEPLILAGMSRARDERSGLEIALPPLAEVGVEEAPLGFPPRLGEHNEAVYGEMLGIESKRLAALRERGVI